MKSLYDDSIFDEKEPRCCTICGTTESKLYEFRHLDQIPMYVCRDCILKHMIKQILED